MSDETTTTDDIAAAMKKRKAKKRDAAEKRLGPLPSAGMPKLTQIGNAERFAEKFGNELRYVAEWNTWLAWDGRRWERDRVGSSVERAKTVVADLYNEAAALSRRVAEAINTDSDDAIREKGGMAEAILDHAKKSSTANAVFAMLQLAKSQQPIAARSESFDTDPMVLNVANGTLDLRDGEIRAHRQSDMMSMLAPVRYVPDAACPTWDAFMARVQPDEHTRAWLQRFLGYALTGSVAEQCLTLVHGDGSNGKSAMLEVVMEVMGDYAKPAAEDLLLAKFGEAHPTEVADLQGARLVVAQEIEEGRRWNEARLKRLTGSDKLKARRMRGDFYEFLPTHKIIVAANDKPRVKGSDHGVWRRMRLVPFTARIEGSEVNKNLVTDLRAEHEGILAWLVRGCLAWQREGLGTSPQIEEETKKYRDEQDKLAHWIEERCAVGDRAWSATTKLYENYLDWWKSAGFQAVGYKPWERDKWRAEMLRRPGISEIRRSHGKVRAIAGVGVRGDMDGGIND